MSKKNFYITTAIDYANSTPHLGHAFEKVGADALARYHRLKGEHVHFLVGLDEHGQKVERTAAEAGQSPEEWTERIAEETRRAWRGLHVEYDEFIRTSQPRHAHTVQTFIRRIRERGDLYRGTYRGLYCVGCEAFKGAADLEGERCPEHPTRELEWVEEEEWFFRLSRYREALLHLLEETDFVQPSFRRAEVRRWLDDLPDLSVSRSRVRWGVPWPEDPERTVYVWFDALLSYLTATGFPDSTAPAQWPASLQVIGKDILRFHAVIWPALLFSAGIAPPRALWVHGFVHLGGGRASSSTGVSVSLEEARGRYGTDALRYFLLREVPWDGDGTFSWERFRERYETELANGLGNLLSRTVGLLDRYTSGSIPGSGDAALKARFGERLEEYREALDAHRLHEGLAAAFQWVGDLNSYVTTREPWVLARDPARRQELEEVLGSLARGVAQAGVLLSPFLPERTRVLWDRLGGQGTPFPPLSSLSEFSTVGWQTQAGPPLFPREERQAP